MIARCSSSIRREESARSDRRSAPSSRCPAGSWTTGRDPDMFHHFAINAERINVYLDHALIRRWAAQQHAEPAWRTYQDWSGDGRHQRPWRRKGKESTAGRRPTTII